MLETSQLSDETRRLKALHDLGVLDTAPERVFDALVEVASQICGTPIALVSLVDTERLWVKANVGFPGVQESPRKNSFCDAAIQGDGIFIVEDASKDPRFADNPHVTQGARIRFYAGVPLRLASNESPGTLCVFDTVPRKLSAAQREALINLSEVVSHALESRRTSRELLSSEARFRAISEASPFGVFETDVMGALRYCNQRFLEIMPLTGDQVTGQGWREVLHPDEVAFAETNWLKALEEGKGFDTVFRIQRPAGDLAWVRAIATAQVNEDGVCTGFVGSLEDVTEDRTKRSSREAERSRYAAILEGTAAGIWEWNIQTGLVRLNARWGEIVGMSTSEDQPLQMSEIQELVHPGDFETVRQRLYDHFEGRSPHYECEMRIRHKDGSWVWVLDRGSVVTRTADGAPEKMFGTHLDISERKAHEKELRRNEWMLNRTGALAEVGGWELDLRTNVINWSDQVRIIHGVGPDYVPTLEGAIDFYKPHARPVVAAAVEQSIKDGLPWDLELEFTKTDGTEIWVRTVCQAELRDGEAIRIFGAIQDITERVERREALERANRRMQIATDSGGIGIWEFDVADGLIQVDDQMRRLYDISEQDGENLTSVWIQRLHPEDRERVRAAMLESFESGKFYEDEFRMVSPDGSIRHIKAAAQVRKTEQGNNQRLLGVNWDVSELRELSAELADHHELLHVTLQSIGDAVITTDASGAISWLNPAAEKLTGWGAEEAIGKPLASVYKTIQEDTRTAATCPALRCLSEDSQVSPGGRTILLSKDGREFGVEHSASPIRNAQGMLYGAVLVFHDVTEQRRLASEMSYRAKHDTLTGLVNRGEFEARLKRALAASQHESEEHALLFIDLDQFKIVNDTCGHAVGDDVLRQVSRMLKESVRECDTLARLGGDEFAIILEKCELPRAREISRKICDDMKEYHFVHDGRHFRVGTSIGLVGIDSRWADISSLLRAADASCYAAKDAGRNRVHVWVESDQLMRARDGELQWASRLELALEQNDFVLYAQRIESQTEASGLLHAEVLLRMRASDGSLVAPGTFLPAAERFHLAPKVDRWVLRHSLLMLRNTVDLSTLGCLYVNLSGQSVSDREFHRDAIEILRDAGSEACSRLCLEITETAAITAIGDAGRFIDQARALGVRIALDDFGAGASSFGYLKKLKIDMIKIDGQFVSGLTEESLNSAAVRSFIDVARVLGVTTVAEHVEQSADLDRVRALGVDYAQGFLLHRPQPIETLLTQRERAGAAVVPRASVVPR